MDYYELEDGCVLGMFLRRAVAWAQSNFPLNASLVGPIEVRQSYGMSKMMKKWKKRMGVRKEPVENFRNLHTGNFLLMNDKTTFSK